MIHKPPAARRNDVLKAYVKLERKGVRSSLRLVGEMVDMTHPTVFFHVKNLVDSGLLKKVPTSGGTHFYHTADMCPCCGRRVR